MQQLSCNVPTLNYFHSLRFFGRSANILAVAALRGSPLQGHFMDNETKIYRSGLLDSVFRFSVNLKGGPAMSPEEYHSWKQKTILGVSLKVVAPTGQYDGTKLINNGSNRWAFKPEFGYSGALGPLGARWICSGLVLHYEPRVFFAQCILSWHSDSIASTYSLL